MDSFAELRELNSLFNSGVLARDASTVGCGMHLCATPTTLSLTTTTLKNWKQCWATTTWWTRAPFWLRYMVVAQVLLCRPFSQGLIEGGHCTTRPVTRRLRGAASTQA